MKSETTSVDSSQASFGSDADEAGDLNEIFEDGEFRILTETLEDLDSRASVLFPPNSSILVSGPFYGNRLSEEKAAALVPPGEDGLVRHAIVIPDNFCTDGKLIGGLNKRDFDLENGAIKPRRPTLPVTQTQLLTSLTKIDLPFGGGPRYIFNGVLNGWPSLRNFELISLEKKRSIGPLTAPDYMNSMRGTWSHYWSAEKEGKAGISPAIKDKNKIYRAKLRGAPWSSLGW
jgi:hypothetical protein